jgi:hypothetical protein
MNNISRLTESDLVRLVKKVINEQSNTGNDRIANIASAIQSLQTKNIPTQVIVNPNSDMNNKTWSEYIKSFRVTPQEISQAKALISKMGGKLPQGFGVPDSPGKPANAPSPMDIRASQQAQRQDIRANAQRVSQQSNAQRVSQQVQRQEKRDNRRGQMN